MLIKESQTTILYGERAMGTGGPCWVSVLSAVERLTNPLIERAPLHLAFKLLNQLQIYIFICIHIQTNLKNAEENKSLIRTQNDRETDGRSGK